MTPTTLQLTERQRERLRAEHVIWLTTVKPNGTPVPTPVWFLWSSDEFLIFSEPGTAKLANISQNASVALNFNSTADGGDVAVFTAQASTDPGGPTGPEWDAYVAKYETAIHQLEMTPEMTPETFRAAYSTLIRVEPSRIRGW